MNLKKGMICNTPLNPLSRGEFFWGVLSRGEFLGEVLSRGEFLGSSLKRGVIKKIPFQVSVAQVFEIALDFAKRAKRSNLVIQKPLVQQTLKREL
jgi:hypothetical protein